MDDLTTLRETWPAPAPPPREARFQARAALMSRAAGAARTDRTAGAEARPARTSSRTTRWTTSRTRTRRIALPRMPRIGVRLVAVGAFAVAIAAGVTVVQAIGGADQSGRPKTVIPGLPAGPVANAQEALERAARVAESKPFVAPRPDQWIYTEERTTASREGRPAGSTEPLSRVIREWRRVDGTQTAYIDGGRLRIQKTPQLPDKHPSRLPKAVRMWESYMKHPATLPADPDAILRLAYRAFTPESIAPDPQNEVVYTMFTHILRENVLPPKVEAAIFRATAKVPGVTLYPKVTDVLGRPALNLGMTTGGDMREDLLLDRQNYTYLGERSLMRKDELSGKIYPDRKVMVKKGTEYVFARTVTKIVDTAGDRS